MRFRSESRLGEPHDHTLSYDADNPLFRGGTNQEVRVIEWKLIDNLSQHLDLCRVGAGSAVAIVADPETDAALLRALELAAQRSRAEWATVTWVGSGTVADHRVLSAAVSNADVVINLAGSAGTHGQISDLASEAEAIVLDVRGSAVDLAWFNAHSGLTERLEAAERLLDGVEWLELTTTADNVLDISTQGMSLEPNSASLSGLDTHVVWPAGSLSVVPGTGSVNGEVTVMPGDINQSARDWFHAPVVLVIADNHLADVLGSSGDADRLLAQLEAVPTDTRHALTGIQIGMHRTVPASAQLLNPRLLDTTISNLNGGHVTLGFGSGPRHELGGLESAIRITLRSASIRADNRVSLVDTGMLASDLAPDVYERASWDA